MTLFDIWTRDHASDFAAGVRLLAANGGEKHLTRLVWQHIQVLAYGGGYVDRYYTEKLGYALQQCNPTPGPSPEGRGDALRPASDNKDAGNVVDSTPPLPRKEGPGVTSDKAKAMHKEHAHVHALMVSADTDEKRAEYARDIKERIILALDAEYDRLRAGVSPPLEGSGEADAISRPVLDAADANAFKKLQSVRSRISALKGKIAKEKDPKRRAELERQLTEKETERDMLQEALS